MRLRTAYVQDMLNPITAQLCEDYDWQAIEVSGDWGYTDYMQLMWDRHEDFINVEQDIIFWPGAIEELWTCPYPWCAYSYGQDQHYPPNVPVLGCAKITTHIMDLVPDLWYRQRQAQLMTPSWSWLDGWLWQNLNAYPHQHYPYVINGGKRLADGEIRITWDATSP